VKNQVGQVVLDRRSGGGRYGDIIDVAVELKRSDYGSAANALAAMVKESPLFRKTLARLRSDRAA
jgi:hypothetical protein